MISALATNATSSASSAAPLRSREQESLTTSEAPEASTVVTLSAAGTSLAASAATTPASTTSSTLTQTAASATPAAAPAATSAAVSAGETGTGASTSTTSTTDSSSQTKLSLVPNLIYAPADRNEDGIISAAEQKAYDLEQFPEGVESKATPPPVSTRVNQELREYAAVAQGSD